MKFTTGQVLERLNISKPTLYKLCRDKNVRPFKTVGGHNRYSNEDLEKLLERKIDNENVDEKFDALVEDVLSVLGRFAYETWGEKGQSRLLDIIEKKKNNFITNISTFK